MAAFPIQPTLRAERAVRGLAIGLWVTLAIVIVVKTVQNPKNHSTYPLFREASLQWWQGINVYDRGIFADDYRYGPSFAMALGPLASLPPKLGAVVWALMNVGVAYWATWALARRVLPGMERPIARYLMLAAALLPSAHCLYSSQTNLLVFALVAFAGIAILDQRWWAAAFLLAIPIHIKVWPLAAALLLAACWPRRLAWRLPIAVAAVGALPLLAKPPLWVWQQYAEWYRYLIGPTQIRHSYRDAWTIWELITAPKPVDARLYAAMQLAAAAAALLFCLWQSRRSTPARTVLCVLACWTTWQLVFGPGTERNTFALIAPLSGWAIVTALLERRAAALMVVSYALMIIASIGWVEDITPCLLAMHPVGVMLFFAWFLRWNRIEGRVAPASSCFSFDSC